MVQTSTFVVDFTFQREWGLGGRRLLIMLALYFGGVGAGLYLVSLLAGFAGAALIGVLIVAIGKGVTHIFFLGRPERFWRAVRRPNSSWISRGFIFFTGFVVFALAYLLPDYAAFSWLPWTSQGAFGATLLGLSVIFAFMTITYTGLLLNRTAVPFWNQSLLPVLFLAVSIFTGADIAHLVYHFAPVAGVEEAVITQAALWTGISTLVLLFFYFWSAYRVNLASQRSVRFLAMEGRNAWYFFGLFLAVGLIFPVVVFLVNAYGGGVGGGLLVVADVVEVAIGAVMFRYLFLRGGVFLPIA
ncbi:MAG: polysulfide reductase NrfD [Chloroflexi bacterium]|nr:polysulfide reductase NrfD [Chloroflexota bacterium]